MRKRFLTLVLAVIMVCSSLSGAAKQVQAATALTEDNMSAVILDMKGRLNIGDEYTDFNYSFYENGNGVNWNFDWSTADRSSYIYAYCDGDGHVLNYNRYDYSDTKVIPQYTAEELIDTAKAAIAQIEPEIADHLAYKNSYSNYYNSSYTFHFVRIENGIEMPENYVNITLNYSNGEVSDYNAEWLYGAEIPGADKLIGEEAAAAKAGQKVSMQLRYYIGYDADGKAHAFLAYTPDNSYVAVDAHTGKLYEQSSYWSSGKEADKTAAEEGLSDNAVAAPKLSEAEMAKIEELKGLLTAEDAVAVLKAEKNLYLEDTINTISSNLYNNGEGKYYWNITLRDNRPYDWENNDIFRAYASASVDAVTGDILSFYASLKSYYDFTDEEVALVKANYTKTQCRKVAEGFLKSVNPDRFAQTVLSSTNKSHAIAYNYDTGKYTYAGFDFSYDRMHENIPVSANGINVSVDAVSGKIFSYNSNWNDDVELPSSEGIIDAKTAFDKYIGFDGFDLIYEIVTNYVSGQSYYGDDVERSVRLVYRTAISPYFVDAFTGKQLGWDGSEYVHVNTEYCYSDIEGTEYERAIKILASLGAGFDGAEFKPGQVITREEFQQLASKLRAYLGYNDYSISGAKELTRQMAAKAVVGYLGYDSLSKLDIYKTGYSDEKKIAKGYTGAVALAKGFGIMGAADGKKFKPSAKVTRAEAAQILLNAISAR